MKVHGETFLARDVLLRYGAKEYKRQYFMSRQQFEKMFAECENLPNLWLSAPLSCLHTVRYTERVS